MTQDPKQLMIVRQSSLKFVAEYLRLIGTPMTMKETIGLCEAVTEYVMDGRTKEVNAKFDAIDNYIAKKFESTFGD
jgi:hypothetical protein